MSATTKNQGKERGTKQKSYQNNITAADAVRTVMEMRSAHWIHPIIENYIPKMKKLKSDRCKDLADQLIQRIGGIIETKHKAGEKARNAKPCENDLQRMINFAVRSHMIKMELD